MTQSISVYLSASSDLHVSMLRIMRYVPTVTIWWLVLTELKKKAVSQSDDAAQSADFHLIHLVQWHTAWLTSTSARMKK
nr:hypothetical protein HmN_000510200 [Hymenolepis microstoma]